MTEKPVQTICGPFDRARLKRLKQTIKGYENDRDRIVMFEGQELLVSFGQYLAEFVETTLGQRNTRGL